MPPTARRCSATSASGTTSSAPACSSTASSRRRSPRRCRCDLPCHCTAVSWHVKGMRPGEGTGYGLRTVADGPRRSPSSLPATPTASICRMAGRGYMLVRGRRVPIVGSVCMDMTMIDVTGMDVSTGDEVVIVGAAGERRRSACARSPRRSARFPTSCSAARARIERCMADSQSMSMTDGSRSAELRLYRSEASASQRAI